MFPTITVKSGSTVRAARVQFAEPVAGVTAANFSIRKTLKDVTTTPSKKQPAATCPPEVVLKPFNAQAFELAFSVPDGVWGIFYAPVIGGPAHELATFHQLYGDVDGVGELTAADHARLTAAIDTARGSPGYDDRLDHNGDGFVNALDVYRGKSEGWSDNSVGTSWSY